MEHTNFNYFYANENEQYLFLQMPIMLIKDSTFKKLSDSAKILYSLLLNRTSLSAKNDWRDSEGRVYIIYVIKDIMEDLNCCEQKALKCMKELKELGLIETVRRGLNKPNIIYVKNFATDLKYKIEKEPENAEDMRNAEIHSSRNAEIHSSGTMGNIVQEQHISRASQNHGNKNKGKKREVSKINVRVTSDVPQKNKPKENFTIENDIDDDKNDVDIDIDIIPDKEPVYDYNTYKAIIRKNISYSHLKQHSNLLEVRMIDELVENMLDVITTKSKTIQINSEKKDRQIVINKYLSLHASDIQHVLMKYQEQVDKITHVPAYLKTLLYTVKQESNFSKHNHLRYKGMI